jgi:hypothetical protein
MNIDALVESFYSKKDETENLINEVFDFLTEMSVKDEAGEKIDIKLPTIKLTENWGVLDNEDRERIETYMKNVAGDTVEAKLESLRSVLEGTRDASIGEILSTLIAVEILSNLAGPIGTRQFTESAAGFIFEGFLAGLFGGKSVQITSPEEIEGMDAAGKPITDVVLGGRHFSLKLLGDKTAVKGSFRNLVNHFKAIDHVVYLDARRTSDGGLQFGEFTITLKDFLDVFYTPFAKFKQKHVMVKSRRTLQNSLDKYGDKVYQVKLRGKRLSGKSNIKPEQFDELLALPDEVLVQLMPMQVSYAEQSFAGSTKLKKLFGSARQFNAVQEAINSGNRDAILNALEQTSAYQKSRQFEFTPKQVEKISSFKELGPPLPLGEGNLKQIWENYADLLMVTIQPVYGYLQAFTDNVNKYFLGVSDKEGTSHSHGQRAIADAFDLRAATDSAVKRIEKEK